MMELNTLLEICLKNNIKLDLQDGKLKVNAPKGVLTDDIIHALKTHKIALLDKLSQNTVLDTLTLTKTGLKQDAPVSFAQKRFWMLQSISPDSSAYHIPGSFGLSGDLDIEKLLSAIESVVLRHDVLRTLYHEEKDQLQQSVVEQKQLPVQVINLAEQSDKQVLKEAINAHKKQVFTQPFDLASDWPFRVRILRCPEQYFEIILCVHHIAADAWSIPIFLKDLESEYQRIINHQAPRVSTQYQYIDYAIWQNERAKQGVFEPQLTYWQQKLADIPHLHEIVTDLPRTQGSLGEVAVIETLLSKYIEQQLTELATKHKTTLFTLLHAVLALLFYRWSGQEHLVLGSPVLGRNLKETEIMCGCFINTLVINNKVNSKQSFSDLLGEVNITVQEAINHQDLPFEKLVESLNIERHLGINPVFQIIFALQQGVGGQDLFHDLKLHGSTSNHSEAKVDLTINAISAESGLRISWQYAKSLFLPETISAMAKTFEFLISQVIAQPDKQVTSFKLRQSNDSLPKIKKAVERLPITYDFVKHIKNNSTELVLADEYKSWDGGQCIEYMAKVQTLCWQYRLQQGDKVLLAFDKRVESYAIIYALWALGIAYVPCSTAMPNHRLASMQQQTGARVAFVEQQGELADSKDLQAQITLADIDQVRVIDAFKLETQERDLAYILFTSGTTGEPKGVCISHAQLGSFIRDFNGQLPNKQLRLAVDVPNIFDASVAGIGLISQGHSLYSINENVKHDPKAFIDILDKSHIEVLFIATSVVSVLFSNSHFVERSSVSMVFGGEACSQKLWNDLADYCQQHDRFALNVYGPTETTVTISCAEVKAGIKSHIGNPLGINTFEVIDQFGHTCPDGMPGELKITGPQVALGYIDNMITANQKFEHIEGGYSSYFTGDLVVCLKNKNYRYVGRNDQQVKFNGYRIELADVEAIAKHSIDIKQISATILSKAGQKFLVLFYVGKPEIEEVASRCKMYLPSYMQPNIIEKRSQLPLTMNGKINKQALTFSSQESILLREEDVTGFCAEIATLWQQYLPPYDLTPQSDFFASGGHSLAAIKVIHALNDKYHLSLPISLLFEFSGLATFAEQVENQVVTDPSDELLASLDESSLATLLEEL